MFIENPILATDNCRYCLMCRHVCPVERVTKREATSPHGWALLIASVQRGLLAWDASRFAGLVAANLPALPSIVAPERCFYYGPEVADLLLVRLSAALEQSPLRACAAPLTLIAGARVAALVHSQQIDGGWGRPQATALRLEALCRGGGPPLAIWRAARYLCDHQRPDGSFEVDGLYRTLGKPPYAFHGHGGPALSAAVALRALAAARPCLESM